MESTEYGGGGIHKYDEIQCKMNITNERVMPLTLKVEVVPPVLDSQIKKESCVNVDEDVFRIKEEIIDDTYVSGIKEEGFDVSMLEVEVHDTKTALSFKNEESEKAFQYFEKDNSLSTKHKMSLHQNTGTFPVVLLKRRDLESKTSTLDFTTENVDSPGTEQSSYISHVNLDMKSTEWSSGGNSNKQHTISTSESTFVFGSNNIINASQQNKSEYLVVSKGENGLVFKHKPVLTSVNKHNILKSSDKNKMVKDSVLDTNDSTCGNCGCKPVIHSLNSNILYLKSMNGANQETISSLQKQLKRSEKRIEQLVAQTLKLKRAKELSDETGNTMTEAFIAETKKCKYMEGRFIPIQSKLEKLEGSNKSLKLTVKQQLLNIEEREKINQKLNNTFTEQKVKIANDEESRRMLKNTVTRQQLTITKLLNTLSVIQKKSPPSILATLKQSTVEEVSIDSSCNDDVRSGGVYNIDKVNLFINDSELVEQDCVLVTRTQGKSGIYRLN